MFRKTAEVASKKPSKTSLETYSTTLEILRQNYSNGNETFLVSNIVIWLFSSSKTNPMCPLRLQRSHLGINSDSVTESTEEQSVPVFVLHFRNAYH